MVRGIAIIGFWALCALPLFAADRPNFLIICADDHAAYVAGAYGNRQVRTPNIDRLASEGMRFDRAYCNSPVCTPSRQSILTGRYPRTIGVTQLRTALPESETTLAEMLGAEGYDTAAIGKMHFNSDARHGFRVRIDLPEHRQWLESRGASPIGEEPVLPPWRPFRDPAAVWLNSRALPYGAVDADMPGTYFADEAAKFIGEERERPFFLMVSFYEPHSPFHFPVEYRGRHAAGEFSAPEIAPEDRWQVPEIFESLTPEEKQGIAAAYYTSVEFLDRNVGRVLDALDRSAHRDNTMVVYLGDHGYMLGEHGRFEKHCSFEPAIRAPLIVRFPGRIAEDASTHAMVEFVDLVPTVLDFCEIEVPGYVQGRSFRRVLEGKEEAHRTHIIAEYSENEEACIRTDRWKLVYITGNRAREDGYITREPIPKRIVQLFDIESDPGELHNLAHDAAQADRVAEMLDTLIAHLKATARKPEAIPDTTDRHALLAQLLRPDDVQPLNADRP